MSTESLGSFQGRFGDEFQQGVHDIEAEIEPSATTNGTGAVLRLRAKRPAAKDGIAEVELNPEELSAFVELVQGIDEM